MTENNQNLDFKDDGSDALMQEQIAHGITQLLDSRADQLSPEQVQRLAAARSAAVNLLAQRQAAFAEHQGTIGHASVLHRFGSRMDQHRVASWVLLILVMLLTFVAIQNFGSSNLESSDAFLLASDLPPEAFADKGFDAWIDTN